MSNLINFDFENQLVRAEIENINEYIDELRQMDTPKGVGLERLQKVA